MIYLPINSSFKSKRIERQRRRKQSKREGVYFRAIARDYSWYLMGYEMSTSVDVPLSVLPGRSGMPLSSWFVSHCIYHALISRLCNFRPLLAFGVRILVNIPALIVGRCFAHKRLKVIERSEEQLLNKLAYKILADQKIIVPRVTR